MTAQNPRSQAQQIITAQNERAIIDARIRGRTYREIADELSMSVSGVCDAFHRVMERTKEETREAELHRRDIVLEQLDADYAALSNAAANGDAEAQRVRLANRLAVRQLLGLDAPTKFTSDSRVEVVITGGESV